MTSLASAATLEREYPEDNRQRGIGVERSRPVPTAGRTPAALFVALLFGLVFLILLIACTNIGGMLLVRGVARSREVALRLAAWCEPESHRASARDRESYRLDALARSWALVFHLYSCNCCADSSRRSHYRSESI
jgi:hypothetical protein